MVCYKWWFVCFSRVDFVGIYKLEKNENGTKVIPEL